MIEVKLILHDAVEVNMVAQLQQMLEMKRAQDNARSFDVPPVPLDADAPPAGEPVAVVDATYDAELTEAPDDHDHRDRRGTEEMTVAELEASGYFAAKEEAPVPDDIAVARAITTYAQREGVEKARELLAEFGAKKMAEIPSEQRAAFVARASA